MVARMTRRAVVGGVLLATFAVPLAAAPASAAGFTSITIRGEGLPSPLDVRGDADPELFAAVLGQVAWMANRAGQTSSPKADKKLGPKYTVVVFAKDAAKQTYELYPLASGGPRAFRPAKQPDRRRTTAAWFFGRLNMSETLRLAGVPLPIQSDTISGGIGGGIPNAEEPLADPLGDLSAVFAQWRRLFLLNGVLVLLIAGGLAGIALLIRPKT